MLLSGNNEETTARRFSSRLYLPLVILITLLLILAPIAIESASPSCPNPRLRKEIRDLSDSEWTAYITGINQLKRQGRFDQYTAIHQQWTQQAHGGNMFLAWHRRFLWTFETELLGITGSALLGIPYFDPFISYSIFDPANPRFMGDASGCVVNGPFQNWTSPDGRCLQHALLAASPAFVDPRAVAQLILSDLPFANFSDIYEMGQHADVHGTIGGQMIGLQWSPADPIFYAHHAHVDQIWYRRQWANVGRLYWDYEGTHLRGHLGAITLNTLIPPWQDSVGAVTDVYRTLCYDYQDYTRQDRNLQRRDLHEDKYRVFDFSESDPLHKCVPMDESTLNHMHVSKEQAQHACDSVNTMMESMNTSGPWVMPHHIPLQTDLAPPEKPPTVASQGFCLPYRSALGILSLVLFGVSLTF